MRARGILFDLDGVLVDTEGLHAIAASTVLKRYGVTIDRVLWNKYAIGRTPYEVLGNLQDRFPSKIGDLDTKYLVREKQKTLVGILRRRKSVLYHGVAKMLEELNKEYSMCIVSSTTKDVVTFVLKRYKIRKFFKAVITGDDVRKGKPNPECYLMGLRKLGLRRKDVVVIEDAPAGIAAARAAGLSCIAIASNYPKADLRRASIIIDDIRMLDKELIERILGRH